MIIPFSIYHKMNIKEKERHLLMWVNAKDKVGHVIMPYKLINCFIAFLSFHVISKDFLYCKNDHHLF